MRFMCVQFLAWSRIPLILILSTLHISLILFLNSVQRYKKYLIYANFETQKFKVFEQKSCNSLI